MKQKRKYSDTQVLDEIIREARRKIRYHTKERNKESHKKIKLVEKRDKIEKQLDKARFRIDRFDLNNQFHMIESMIRWHESILDANESILKTIKQYRQANKKTMTVIPKNLPIDTDLFTLTSTPLDHKGIPVIAVSGLAKVTKPQQKLLLELLMTMVDGVERKYNKRIEFEK